MDQNRYKRYHELGDKFIPKRTAHRYSEVISSTAMCIEEAVGNFLPIISDEIINDIESHHEVNVNAEMCHNLDCTEIAFSGEFLNDLDEYLHKILLDDKIRKSLQSPKNSKSLDEMINSKDFFDPLSIQVEISKGELLLMILKYSIVNSLSVTAMTNLFKLINIIFQSSILPDSRYYIDKLFDSSNKVEFHAVCYNCTAYIGNFNEINNVKQCHLCNTELDLSNATNTSFFVLIDPSSQIKDLIITYKDHYEYVIKERLNESTSIRDVYDGKEYRTFVRNLPEEEKSNYVSAVFNTDGASTNELPKQDRMSKLVTCGLWFNKQKPDMSIFLSPFVHMMNKLTKDGIQCTINEVNCNLKLYIVNCCVDCVDSVARAPIQGVKQFNGKSACNWCLHPGVWVEDSMKYTLLETTVQSRTHENTVHNMMIATPQNSIDDIKYPSPLINLPFFNIISGFVPDYMHCCLEGVAKQLTEYYLSTMNNEDIIEIDSKINKITAPHQISRLSRPISIRNEWKAREWENYTLYYSVVVLTDHLKRDYYEHWLLFVESLYLLLQDNIHIDDINQANKMLYEFVCETEKFFGQKAMTYNIHQLLHLAESVFNWGPLWCHSTFSFESANHDLLKAIKSSKGVTSQIIRFIKLNHTTSVLRECAFPYIDETVKIYCDDILEPSIQNFSKILNITYFGKGETIDDLLSTRFGLPTNALVYYKLIKDGCLYESNLKQKRRSNNAFVLLKDNSTFVRIEKFIIDEESKQELTICSILKTRHYFTKHYHMLQLIEKIEPDYSIIHTQDIKTISTMMNVMNKLYLTPLPNLLHY
ncbi:uncharacterized protein LOC100678206 [Nasonia vitripennis]|uniref:Uncharacterized protein n=1 Tax=Nasonia vitripennis TaxID=7425 RepID=A0A7M7ILV0_NASVI|nr:uncharacterized protein LOC100678206 [Nasonia vitripennis]